MRTRNQTTLRKAFAGEPAAFATIGYSIFVKEKRIIRTLIAFALFSAAIHATSFGYTENAGKPSKASIAVVLDDTSSVDALLKALYESITFAEGNVPDLSRFRRLFATEAPCIRINKDQSVDRMTVNSFILSFRERIKSGTLKSFHEAEIARKTQRFGQMAHVLSTYQKGLNVSDSSKMIKGINSIQLFYDGRRWWIGSLMWMDERPEMPIPLEYRR
jgi:hypothetical protein